MARSSSSTEWGRPSNNVYQGTLSSPLAILDPGPFCEGSGVKYVAVEWRPTIMLADDDPALLEKAADALRGAGYKVVQAADGQEALQEALSRKVNLIVMDASMPEVNGVEACHCLKAMPKTQKIPVVLTVGKKDTAARTLGERTHGSVRILRKPFSPDELVALTRQLVKPKSLL